VLGRDGVVGTANATLDRGPEAIDRVGVDVSAHVDLLSVVDAAVLVDCPDIPVAGGLVGVDDGGGQNLRFDVLGGVAVFHRPVRDLNSHLAGLPLAGAFGQTVHAGLGPTPLHDALSSATSGRTPLGLSAVVSLIELDSAFEHPLVLSEQGANLVEHAPSRLVGDSKLTL